MTDKVSIIIPTFNRADLLIETIESCLAQTYPCEIIVVAHGCTDHTADVAARYHDKITYIHRDKDFGPHFCWLEGVLNANYPYIHINFDDDLIEPEFLSECMKHMQGDVGFVFSAIEIFDPEKQTKIASFDQIAPESGIYKNSLIKKKLMKSLISPGAVVYRKQDVIDALYQGNLPIGDNHYHGVGPDCFMTLLCLSRYSKFGYVKQKLARFRAHPGSITINAHNDSLKKKKIKAAYGDVRFYYRCLSWMKLFYKIHQFLKK